MVVEKCGFAEQWQPSKTYSLSTALLLVERTASKVGRPLGAPLDLLVEA